MTPRQIQRRRFLRAHLQSTGESETTALLPPSGFAYIDTQNSKENFSKPLRRTSKKMYTREIRCQSIPFPFQLFKQNAQAHTKRQIKYSLLLLSHISHFELLLVFYFSKAKRENTFKLLVFWYVRQKHDSKINTSFGFSANWANFINLCKLPLPLSVALLGKSLGCWRFSRTSENVHTVTKKNAE